MNKFSLFTQVGMIAVAVAIVIMYIKPTITQIRETQDLTTSYETESANVSAVNEKLKVKIAEIEAINPSDIAALTRFMPDTLDEISVLKDISAIVTAGSVSIFEVSYKGVVAAVESDALNNPNGGEVISHNFSLSFNANYSQLKSVLALLETNAYVLQISNLKIAANDKGVLKVDMSLTAFSRFPSISVIK